MVPDAERQETVGKWSTSPVKGDKFYCILCIMFHLQLMSVYVLYMSTFVSQSSVIVFILQGLENIN